MFLIYLHLHLKPYIWCVDATMEFKGVKQLILILYTFQCTIFPVILSGVWGYHSHGADSENLDFLWYILFLWFYLKKQHPFHKVSEIPFEDNFLELSTMSAVHL